MNNHPYMLKGRFRTDSPKPILPGMTFVAQSRALGLPKTVWSWEIKSERGPALSAFWPLIVTASRLPGTSVTMSGD